METNSSLIDQLIKDSIDQYVKGNLKIAEIKSLEAIKINPSVFYAYFILGAVLHDQKRFEDARLATLKGIDLEPNFTELYFNLASIYWGLGEREKSIKTLVKILNINPDHIRSVKNLLIYLSKYVPSSNYNNSFLLANDELRLVNSDFKNYSYIEDKDICMMYQIGMIILNKYNINIDYDLIQIHRKNSIDLNCSRHLEFHKIHKAIPEFCFGCYKVQIEVKQIIDLIKLYLLFNEIELKNNNYVKFMVEKRSYVPGFYKVYIYCSSLIEAREINLQIAPLILKKIGDSFSIKEKRGCSEYAITFPKYADLTLPEKDQIKYKPEWKQLEYNFDRNHLFLSGFDSDKSLKSLCLKDFLIIRNWLAYAEAINDESVKKITQENFKNLDIFKFVKNSRPCK